MSERKVLNKYYPPDFDPSKIPKLKLPKDRQYVVRLMAPFNMRCTTCGEYIYKGKKFNARKETVQGETYLGLLIFRFYIRCPRCISEITFKTDPENTDYVCEKGATRNFQAQLMMERQEEAQKKEREEDELNNPMKALENRTKESKQEMDILEKLEELRDLNTRQAEVNYEKMLDIYQQYEKEIKEKEEKEDEELVKSIFGSNKIQRRLSDSGSDSNDDSQEKLLKSSKQTEIGKKRATDVLTQESKSEPPNKKANLWDRGIGKLGSKVLLDSLVKVKNHNKPRNSDRITEKIGESASRTASDNLQSSTTSNVEQEPSTNEDGNGSLGLLGSYGSSSDSE